MRSAGKIVTFYSYKGGTGRSMALANVAWILASNQKRVLVIDWDLEAPGLHRYFHPFLVDKDLLESEGLIDYVINFSTAAASPTGDGGSADRGWYKDYTHVLGAPTDASSSVSVTSGARIVPGASLLTYAVSLEWDFGSGALDFIPAGRQGSTYSTRVNSFSWQKFYERLGGGLLLDEVKENLKKEYDYILIDSRTGVSDTSGICTVQMPDILVVCFTLNNQSIEGAAGVAEYVQQQRGDSGLEIYPVPMRVENAEKKKRDTRMEYAKQKFARFPNVLRQGSRPSWWLSP